jgi:hypothetical protein
LKLFTRFDEQTGIWVVTFPPIDWLPSHIFASVCAIIFRRNQFVVVHCTSFHKQGNDQQPHAMKPAHRAAIALNNLAGNLLERGCDSEAISTFRGAVSLMQAAHQDPTPVSEASIQAATLESEVSHAFQRMTKSFSTEEQRSSFMRLACVSDDSDFASVDSVLESDPLSLVAWLIRIEEYGSDGLSQRNFDVDTAVILHNYGMACLYHSTKQSSTRATKKLRLSAVNLVSWSRAVLSACVKKSEADENTVLGERVLLIAMIVTRSMAQTIHYAGHDSQVVQDCLLHLNHLRTMAHELGYCNRSQLIAAAAA